MSKGKNINRNDVSDLKDTINTLKGMLKKEKALNKRLLSEIKTLESAFSESILYINKELIDVPLPDVMDYFKDKKNGEIDEVKDMYNQRMDKLDKDWKCHKCDEGTLKLIVIERHDGKHYFRACGNKKCPNRTKLKKWHPDISE